MNSNNTHTIERFDNLGNGLVKVDGKVIFVSKAIPGDVVELKIIKEKAKFAEAKVKKYIKRANNYQEAFCKHFYSCGGCDIQNILHQQELNYKEELIKREFPDLKINKIIYDKDKAYRNKAVFHYEKKLDRLGFYEKGSNQVVSIGTCPLLKEEINEILKRLNSYFNKRNENVHTVTVRVSNKNEKLISVYGSIKQDNFIDTFHDIDSIYLNDECIHGKKYIIDNLMGYDFALSNDSFYQVNRFVTEKLYGEVTRHIKNKQVIRALDLYCGTGTISLLLSKYAKEVIAIDNNEESIDCANKNKKINKVDNVKFILGDASKETDNIKDVDLIVVDPPRAGLTSHAVANLLKIKAKTIIYVSCNYSTLKKDLQSLSKDYDTIEITPVDMFSHTYHVETVVLMSRVDK